MGKSEKTENAGMYWIWYPGDMELYHGMKQNFSRVERGLGWPAFWKSEGWRNRVVFARTYELEAETDFAVYTSEDTSGYVLVRRLDTESERDVALTEKKGGFGNRITCGPGRFTVIIHLGSLTRFPAAYVEGEVIYSDGSWMAGDYDKDSVPCGTSRYFTDPAQDPAVFPYAERVYAPLSVEEVRGGVLFAFETELTAQIEVTSQTQREVQVFPGESRAEALDTKMCYNQFTLKLAEADIGYYSARTPRAAVRYVYLPGVTADEVSVRAIHQYVDIPVRADFASEDGQLQQIWDVAAHTFRLCSDVFFLDGVKRDRWIWGGDAYQSLFVNRYLTADADIERRTLLALRGNDPVTTHVNTIIDYSMMWILSVEEYYNTYGDAAFVRQIFPKVKSMTDLLLSQREGHGFLVGRAKDWTYIDWADFDREGPLCAEQMLLAASLSAEARLQQVACGSECRRRDPAIREELLRRIDEKYWDEGQQAYVDSFVSGRQNVTRHANILAILFDLVPEKKKRSIAEHVLLNDDIPAITTPYFRFFELDALCRLGYLDQVLPVIRSYWGGMLEQGAVTFWEEFDPDKPADQQYEMYGDPFGKSMCHAWAASPIYLLSRYFIGLELTAPGGQEYRVQPQLAGFRPFMCILPIGGSGQMLQLRWDGEAAQYEITRDEG